MVKLINQLLDLDKIEAGKFDLLINTTSLGDVVAHSIDAIAGLTQEKGVTVETSIASVEVAIDAERMVQVIVNLLSNAIKFSPEHGKISIATELGVDWVLLSVSDQGCGIDESQRTTIFDRFSQVSRADALERQGTGLGLAICKAIVEAHGGQIGVRPAAGGGSMFWLRLPKS